MAGAEIGGDSSVEWDVTADHVRQNPNPPTHGPHGAGGWNHHGTDETGFGGANGYFFSLKMPRLPGDAAEFVDTLRQASAAAQALQNSPGQRIEFTLPIETESRDQIRITWNSTALPPGHRPYALAARKSARPGAKRAKAKSPKRAAKKTATKKAVKRKTPKRKSARTRRR